tara:strand:- start:242 stop:550 length:309 start_codon:yes stop_codon:yes gene_type:complete
MSAYLVVRAKVDENICEKFDKWYEDEHLPDALREFKAVSAKRGWSEFETNTHVAFYEFENLTSANKLLESDIMKEFITDFDRHWGGKVTRTRELIEIKQFLK